MKTKFIIFIVIIIALIGGLGFYLNRQPSGPGKLDGFAQGLKSSGVVFYGAFWCPHCQSQKAEFGSSVKYLPYVECSNPDSTPIQVCTDNKVEAFPTWEFRDGIKITSKDEPTICPLKKEGAILQGSCINAASEYYRVWIFPGYKFSVKSPTDPIKNGDVWQFPAKVQAVGEVPLEYLAEQIQFILPQ